MTTFFLNNERYFWFLIIVVAIGDLLVPYLLAPFYKGYSHKTMVMSSLGNLKSPVKMYYNGWLILGGILLCIFSVFFYIKFNMLLLVLLLLIFAIGGMILAGLFSVNETKELVTRSSKIHGYGSVLGFISLLFGPLVVTIQANYFNTKNLVYVAAICFVIAFLTFVLFVMSDKPNFKNTIIRYEGIWQRVSLLFMYVPLVYMAIYQLCN